MIRAEIGSRSSCSGSGVRWGRRGGGGRPRSGGCGRAWAALIAIGVLLVSPSTPARAAGTETGEFVIQNVRIFDGERVIPRGQVWVRKGKIAAVGSRVDVSAGAPVRDGDGQTLLPGLIDAHTHVFGEMLRDALVFGVTTELDMFTDHTFAAGIKREQAAGRDLDMADLRSAGTLATAPHGHGTEYGMAIPTIAGPDEAQEFVDARIAEGSDYIKIIYDDEKAYGREAPTISKETLAALIKAAHRRHLLAVVHIGSLAGARDALEAGADGLAHLFVDAPPDPGFAKLAADHHAFVVPTLSVLASLSGGRPGPSLSEDPRLRPYLSSMALSGLGSTFGFSAGSLSNAEDAVKQLQALHVPILAGTDAPNPGTTHGASMHGELELLVGSGLSPVEALTAATAAPARIFHLQDRGRIAKGMRADLLLVRGDPTTDITATRDIVSVWKQGVEVDRASYLAAREDERKAAEAQKQAPPPAGSESGLVSDFEDGTTKARFGFGWTASTDSIMGGKSRARMHLVEGGADGSKEALQVDGEVVAGAVAWAGAMYFPADIPMSPANLSRKTAISFWTRGDGQSYLVMVYTKSGGYIPKTRSFETGEEWKMVTMKLSDFGTDGHDITGILFGVYSTPGRFDFRIDNVRFD
jgi:imidazolonepropionase-like amidohydrolase